jgi:hypothetical protein
LPDVEGSKSARKKFKTYPIGFFHIGIAEVRTEGGKLQVWRAEDGSGEADECDDAARKLLFLVLRHAAKAWRMQPREWVPRKPSSPSSGHRRIDGPSRSDFVCLLGAVWFGGWPL